MEELKSVEYYKEKLKLEPLNTDTMTLLAFSYRVLYDPQLSYLKYLFYGVMVILVQIIFLKSLVAMLIEEKVIFSKMKVCSLRGD